MIKGLKTRKFKGLTEAKRSIIGCAYRIRQTNMKVYCSLQVTKYCLDSFLSWPSNTTEMGFEYPALLKETERQAYRARAI